MFGQDVSIISLVQKEDIRLNIYLCIRRVYSLTDISYKVLFRCLIPISFYSHLKHAIYAVLHSVV